MIVVTWNVQWFCGLDGVVSVERVIEEARAFADFDVLCLQEVAVGYPGLTGGAGFDQVQRVRDRLPGFEVAFGASVDERSPDGGRRRFGNLIASRLPVEQVEHWRLPWPADAGAPSMPRLCSVATLVARSGPLRVMTTHLEYYSRRIRAAQAGALLDLHAEACALAAAPPAAGDPASPYRARPLTSRALLCGDFNFGPDAPEHALLQRPAPPPATRLRDAWSVLHGAAAARAPTFCVHEQRYAPAPFACDFVFVSEDLAPAVRELQVQIDTRASDHQPVRLTLDA